MAIDSRKYVVITSGVGGASAVSGRELMLRVFSTNELIPTGSTLVFSDADSVLEYFGSDSDEYKRAVQYKGFVSKAITSPGNIAFARYADTDTSASVFGSNAGTLAELNAITNTAITVTLGGVAGTINADLSLATDYASVALELQSELQLNGGGYAAATVTYNALKTQFILKTNGAADGSISISGTASVLGVLGWAATAIFSAGIAEQSISDVLSESVDINNNFGSYLFSKDLTLEQHVESAAWNVTRNNEYQYHVPVLRADVDAYYDALNGYAGTGRTLIASELKAIGQYHEEIPACLLGSQRFNNAGAVASYMFFSDSRMTPTVTSTAESNYLDSKTTNYYGQTQVNGSEISFYQRGVLGGGLTSPRKMGVFANEQWLKSDLTAEFFNMQLALPIVSADDNGRAVAFSYLQATVDKALINGAISQGKKLTTTQIQYINQISGRDDAHFQVASVGYWYDVIISTEIVDGVTEYHFDYTLIYAKRDSIDKVVGRHILI